MSRGPGRIERAIEAVLDAEPDNAFTTDDLCNRVYGNRLIEKKHRVAVIRAATSVAKGRSNLNWWRSETLGGKFVFFTADNVMSYAMARLKSGGVLGGYYRNTDPRIRRRSTEEDLLARLGQGGDHRSLVEPGGAWWRHTEAWKARRDGDDDLAEKLEAENKRQLAMLGVRVIL